MDIKLHIGKRIKELRIVCGYNQQQLADYVGFDRAALAMIETGKNSTPVSRLWLICSALNCTPNDLFPPVPLAETKKIWIEKTVLAERTIPATLQP